MRVYCDLLRQHGLIPCVGDTGTPSSLRAAGCFPDSTSRQVIEMQGYETWDDVIRNAREFIRALYTRERITSILERRLTEGDSNEVLLAAAR
jgi:hypothetical protein